MSSSNFTIVVAEDEELLLNHLVEKLTQYAEGFKVIGKAQTGFQALNLIAQLAPDVLITDIQMPNMNGIELLEQVHAKFPHVKCIILSGYAEFAYAQKAIHYGVTEYLLKPIDPADLSKVFSKVRLELLKNQPQIEAVYEPNMLRTPPHEIAHTLHDYIIKNFAQEINWNDLSKQLNYSSSYLTKAFDQEYHTSPTKFLIQIRLTQAKQLLSQHYELSIQQVGEMVGYADQSYFSRLFKKITGLSPLEYRNKFYSY